MKSGGRAFDVEIHYSREPVPDSDYVNSALRMVLDIHLDPELPGNILAFLTGQGEIDIAVQVLGERMREIQNRVPGLYQLIAISIDSVLPSEQQSKIVEPAPPGAKNVFWQLI